MTSDPCRQISPFNVFFISITHRLFTLTCLIGRKSSSRHCHHPFPTSTMRSAVCGVLCWLGKEGLWGKGYQSGQLRMSVPLRLSAANRRRVQRRAFTLTRPLRPQGFAVAVILTRSRHKRCVQPVYVCAAASSVAPVSSAFRRVFVAARRNRVPHIREECVYVPFYSG